MRKLLRQVDALQFLQLSLFMEPEFTLQSACLQTPPVVHSVRLLTLPSCSPNCEDVLSLETLSMISGETVGKNGFVSQTFDLEPPLQDCPVYKAEHENTWVDWFKQRRACMLQRGLEQ